MTGIDKKMVWGMVGLVVLLFVSVYSLTASIKKSGGLEGIAIEAGKSAKRIYTGIKDGE